MSFLKLNENYETSQRSMKDYSDEIFVEELRSMTKIIPVCTMTIRTLLRNFYLSSILLHQLEP